MADPYWIGGFEGAYASGQALFYQDSGPNRGGGRVDGTYQGIWRKMGVYADNHVPGGYRYNWHSQRYEDIFGNEVDFNTAFNQTISDYGK